MLTEIERRVYQVLCERLEALLALEVEYPDEIRVQAQQTVHELRQLLKS